MKRLLIIPAMLIAASLIFVGCKKEKTEENENSSNEPTTEGIYLGVIGFNSTLTTKNISKLTTSTSNSFVDFVYSLSSGNGTGLYFADYSALKMMKEYSMPPKLKNVALVTFTDGLDNVSLANDEFNPEGYNSTSEYREGLHNKIINEQIHGINVQAYTIGLKGNDVTDNAVFTETLNKLASSSSNVFQVANMNEAMQRFSDIANSLNQVSTTVSLGVDVPGGYDDGQMLRFTFDNASSATSSSRYIQATFRRVDGRTLADITYVGFAQGATSITSSSSQGAYYHFIFENLTYNSGTSVSQSDLNNIVLWKKTSTGNWDRESEFVPGSSSSITEEKSSALIMLVLDCTNSLGSDFSKMQQASVNFIEVLANASSKK